MHSRGPSVGNHAPSGEHDDVMCSAGRGNDWCPHEAIGVVLVVVNMPSMMNHSLLLLLLLTLCM